MLCKLHFFTEPFTSSIPAALKSLSSWCEHPLFFCIIDSLLLLPRVRLVEHSWFGETDTRFALFHIALGQRWDTCRAVVKGPETAGNGQQAVRYGGKSTGGVLLFNGSVAWGRCSMGTDLHRTGWMREW